MPKLSLKISRPWIVLYGLLALLTLAALTFDRSTWPALMGDEASYLMQAESLAWDQDASYSGDDYRRFVGHWQRLPQGLILQSGDHGAHVVYGKPFFYALYLAPFVRLAPVRGAFVANALLLAFASVAAARVLERRSGPLAPLWVAVLVFASVTFAHVFWAHPDLFLMCLTALALALAFDGRQGGAGGAPRILIRWAVVGGLLAVVAVSRPPYLALFLPALLAVPRPSRRLGIAALAAGGLSVAAAAGLVQQSLSDSWTSYGAERLSFYRHTGFLEIDFPAAEWPRKIEEYGSAAAAEPTAVRWDKRLAPSLWLWNSVYFVIGRHVGILPYFLPLVLGLVGGIRGWWSWSLVLAVAAASAVFLLWMPFNFYGGGGALANRYFLPLYPAFWFMPARLPSRRWLVAVAAVSSLFVWELWLAAREFPVTVKTERDYRYVSPVAERILPFETTLSHLKLAGRDDLYPGFFVRFLDHEPWLDKNGGPRLFGGRTARLLVASEQPLTALILELEASAAVDVGVGNERARRLDSSDSVQRFRVPLAATAIRHPMWWSQWKPVRVYRLSLRFDGVGEDEAVPFRLSLPAAESDGP
ncbi:MAG: hypothetical protein V3T72_03530 [Thermoanaerobaculia bacterium]